MGSIEFATAGLVAHDPVFRTACLLLAFDDAW